MITELRQPLPLWTPRGPGWCYFVIDYGSEHDLLWVVFLNDTGECWTFPNPVIRMTWNESLGRPPCPKNTNKDVTPKDGTPPDALFYT